MRHKRPHVNPMLQQKNLLPSRAHATKLKTIH